MKVPILLFVKKKIKLSFVLFGPLIAQKNGNDTQNVTDQKLLDVQNASSKGPQLWASNDVEDMLEDFSAQDILGPKEDLLAALERMPKSVIIEATAQTKSKAPGKASIPELSQAGKVLLQGPSKVFLQDKTELTVPSQRSGQSVLQISSPKTEAVSKVTIQTQSKDSTPVRSVGLAPNKLLVSGVVSSPTLSESLIPVKTVLPTQSKNTTLDIFAVSPSSKAAAEAKASTPSISQNAASVRAAESAQIQAGATAKAAVQAPSNKTKTSVGPPLASYKGIASYRTLMPTQSEAEIQGRVAAWAPSKDMSLSTSTSSALQEGHNQVKTVAPVPSKAAAQRNEGLVPVKISETVQSKNTSSMGLTFGKYAAPVIDKIEFQGLVAPPTTSEAALPVKDALPTFHKDGGPIAVPAPVSGISSVLGKKSVTTAIDSQDRNAKAEVTKFSLSRQEPSLVPGKSLAPVIDRAPTLSKDPFVLGFKIDSALGKAVELPTTAGGASERPSILSQSKSPVSVKDSVTSRDRDIAFGVAAAKAPTKVTFSPSTLQSEKTSPVKAEEPVLVQTVGSRMEPTPAKAAVPTNAEFLGQDKFVSSSLKVGQAFVKDTVQTTEFSEGSKLPTTVKALPTLCTDAISAAAPTPLSSIGSTICKNTTSSTNEAADIRGTLPALAKFEVIYQAAPSEPGERFAPITDALLEKSKEMFLDFTSVKLSSADTESGKAVSLETKEYAAESKVSLPDSTKFLFPHQVVLPQPSEDPVVLKDSVPQPGGDGFLGVRAKTPTRVSFSGLDEPFEQRKETIPVRATYSEDSGTEGSALSFGIKQGKVALELRGDSVPDRRDISQTIQDTLSETESLVPDEGTISESSDDADSSESPISVTATSYQIKYPVLSETEVADIGKVTSPVASKVETYETAALPPEPDKGLDTIIATQSTSEDLFTVKSAVLAPEATPRDEKAESASDVFDQGTNEFCVIGKDQTVQNESLAHNETLVKGKPKLLAHSQDFIPEPRKDYATVEQLSLASHEVLPASSELLAFGTTTVAAPEEDFDAIKTTTSALNDATIQVKTEKPATGEDLSPGGAAFPGQSEGQASEALTLCFQ